MSGNQQGITQNVSGSHAIAAGGNIGTVNGKYSQFVYNRGIIDHIPIDLVNVEPSDFPRAHTAGYDCTGGKREPCLKGTRQGLLDKIYQWINPPSPTKRIIRGLIRGNGVSSAKGNSKNSPIFWLTGLAGTGKSAIAQTVAEYCATRGWLAASFFFARDEDERNNPKLVFSTIAYQLSTTFHQPLMPLMQEAIRTYPDIWYSDPSYQLKRLIVEPIRRLVEGGNSIPSPAVIVLDAFDECKDDNTTLSLASILASSIDDLPFLIFAHEPTNTQNWRNFSIS